MTVCSYKDISFRCNWYNIYDKEQLKADIEDAYHSQEITN